MVNVKYEVQKFLKKWQLFFAIFKFVYFPKPNFIAVLDSHARPQRTAPLSDFGGGRPFLDV